ncbi:MAG: SlyX family protein [Pseudomonadota bacterium]|nr:SlyX family protein [Pseudomonadota bacterium]
MSDASAPLESRLVELETRLSFQEHALGELSDALAAARDEGTRNALLLHRVLEELKQLRGSMSSELAGDSAHEPPPPHY